MISVNDWHAGGGFQQFLDCGRVAGVVAGVGFLRFFAHIASRAGIWQ